MNCFGNAVYEYVCKICEEILAAVDGRFRG